MGSHDGDGVAVARHFLLTRARRIGKNCLPPVIGLFVFVSLYSLCVRAWRRGETTACSPWRPQPVCHIPYVRQLSYRYTRLHLLDHFKKHTPPYFTVWQEIDHF